MTDEPLLALTSTTLLEGLRDPGNRAAWEGYVERYRPLIVQYVNRVGVPSDEAEDVAQTALLVFAKAYVEGRYERGKGRLSSWLFGIVHNQVRTWLKGRRDREVQAPDTQAIFGRLEGRDELERAWAEQWQEAVLRQCLEIARREVKPSSMRAFEMFALEGKSAEEVAAELDTTPNAVFLVKRRVLARIRELKPIVEDLW